MGKSRIVLSVVALSLAVCAGNAPAALLHYWSCDPSADNAQGLGDTGGYTAVPTGTSTNPPVRIAGATGIANSAVKIYGGSGGGTGGYKTTLTNLGTVFTYEMMIRFDAYAYNWGYITDRAGGPITLAAYKNGGALNVTVGATGLGGNAWAGVGQWWLLALVCDGTTATLYATPQGTGTQHVQSSAACTAAAVSTQGLSIGCCDGSRFGANGYVDWVGVWDEALTPAQLATHNLSNTPIPEPATMTVLAIGGLGVLLKRRRR